MAKIETKNEEKRIVKRIFFLKFFDKLDKTIKIQNKLFIIKKECALLLFQKKDI